MNLFIVQHTPTKLYLPPIRSYHSTTSADLSETPRTFPKRQYAVAAAKMYAQGVWGMGHSTDWETGITEQVGIECYPVEGRRLKDFVVIPVTLQKQAPEAIA